MYEFTVTVRSLVDGPSPEAVRDEIWDNEGEWFEVGQVRVDEWQMDCVTWDGNYEISGHASVIGAPKAAPAYVQG